MTFEVTTPAVVRSIVQRDMLNAWIRLRHLYGGFVPVAEYAPARFGEEKKDLVYYYTQMCKGGWDFIIASKGSSAAQAYGTVAQDSRGMRLHDYLRPEMRPLVLPLYEACAANSLPVYSSSLLRDVQGNVVIYERLLLPFHHEGRVHQIIASLKAISEEGKFEIADLLRDREKLPHYTVRALIREGLKPGAVELHVPALADDVVEI